jgi:hypothetical protein
VTVRWGRVRAKDTPMAGARIRTFQLDTGSRVYVPRELCAYMFESFSPVDTLYFIERGPLGRTEWVGWLSKLKAALYRGELTERDIRGFIVPPDPEFPPGWVPVLRGEDHDRVGAHAFALTINAEHGRDGFTVDRWFKYGEEVGLCLTERFDRNHRSVFCVRPGGHSGDHIPECPGCEAVALDTKLTFMNVGQWN